MDEYGTALVHDAETALMGLHGQLGPWERLELDNAANTVRVSYLTLALNYIGKAIAVHRLPPDEYEFGFNFPKRSPK